MENRRKRKKLTGAVIGLSITLCLLVGMVLFLEYRSQDTITTDPTLDTPAGFQSGTGDLLPVGEAEIQDAPEVSDEKEASEEKTEDMDTPNPQPAPESEDVTPVGNSGYGEEKPKTEEPKQEDTNSDSSGPGESEQAGGEEQTSSRPTESGPVETVPIDTSNMTDEF